MMLSNIALFVVVVAAIVLAILALGMLIRPRKRRRSSAPSKPLPSAGSPALVDNKSRVHEKQKEEADGEGFYPLVLFVENLQRIIFGSMTVIVSMVVVEKFGGLKGSGILFVATLVFILIWLILWKIGVVTPVKESTAMFVIRGGSRQRTLFSKYRYRLDHEDNLVRVKYYVKPLFGGWRFVGIPWLDTLYTYNWAWRKVDPAGKIVERDENGVNNILVGQVYNYGSMMRGREVVDKNLVPVEADIAWLMMIVNPRKAEFDVRDWFGTTIAILEKGARDYINSHAYEVMIADNKKRFDFDLMDIFSNRGDNGEESSPANPSVVDYLRTVVGVKLVAVACKGLRLEGKYQDIKLEGFKGEQDAMLNAGVVTGLAASIANITGQPLAEIQKKFREDFAGSMKTYGPFMERSQFMLLKKLGYDAGAVHEYDFHGAQGGVDLAATLGSTLRGGPTPTQGNQPSGGKPVAGFGGNPPSASSSDSNDSGKSRHKKEERRSEEENDDDDDDDDNQGGGGKNKKKLAVMDENQREINAKLLRYEEIMKKAKK
jgi:hypothetical protein